MEELLEDIENVLCELCNNDILPIDVVKGISLIDVRELIRDLSLTNLEFFKDLLFNEQPDLITLFKARRINYDENECCLCYQRPCGVVHVLAACPISLKEGRFYNRHDAVLEIIKEATEEVLLQPEWDVQMSRRDLNIYLQDDIYPSYNRKVPNLFALSRANNKIFLVMVTVPWIENMANDHEMKTNKYLEMLSSIKEKGYQVAFHAVEVSYSGIPSVHLLNYLLDIGLDRRRAMHYIYRICRLVIKSSQDIWNFWASEEAEVHNHIADLVLQYEEEDI